jgi:imidazolonepropionase-like amidohydrolase
LALAAGLDAQRKAVGEAATMLVNVIKAVAEGNVKITPDVQVSGEGDSSGGLMALVMAQVAKGMSPTPVVPTSSSTTDTVPASAE